MARSHSVTHVSIKIEENRLKEGAYEILRQIRPLWSFENIKFKVLTDGITNQLISCKLSGIPAEESVLIRVHGNKSDVMIDRNAEKRNILILNNAGLPPRLYATFENGLAYQFIPGRTLNTKLIAQPEIYQLVATHMARMHQLKIPNTSNEPMLWTKMWNFFNLLPQRFSDPVKQKRFEEIIIPQNKILEEMNILKKKLCKLNSPLVFTHNDLLLGNIIYTPEKNQVSFIDYEYSALNYQAYDIGNHFAEFVGLENVDYSNYPNKELQWDWLRIYLSALQGDNNVSDRDIQKLYVQANQFSLVSHIFWGIWSLLQAEHSNIDFNFMEYAAIRFNEYYAKKDIFLSLDLPR
ncbi:hypothetical protein FQR65_LT05568 [Abscondita terminalis]|nr:hypothetical protein FQR65_LT05568 [Abscondita terminalis]